MDQRNEQVPEHPSTYFVQNRADMTEMMRVTIQDKLITTGMGGVLPEQEDTSQFTQVLDVACGTGGWLIQTALQYPHITTLVGVDISERMIQYAQQQVDEQQLQGRVRFATMDALRMLEFPNESFDLVNMRLSMSFLRTWDWPKLLQELQRIVRPDGVIRITESEMLIRSSSTALTSLYEIALAAAHQAGHFFAPTSDGVTGHLASLLAQHGLHTIKTHPYTLLYQAGTPEGTHFYEDMKRTFQVALPFYRKWTTVPENYDDIYQQALHDMQQPDFLAEWHLLTVWGQKEMVNTI